VAAGAAGASVAAGAQAESTITTINPIAKINLTCFEIMFLLLLEIGLKYRQGTQWPNDNTD
jgi:hypothetical protein